jgi:uncharacterized phiE125 gp8 family phage protein
MIKPTAGRTVLVSASTGAPVVGLSLVKLQLAIDHTDDDELLRHYVAAAINLAKDYLEADLLSTGYSQKHDDFSGGEITLERWPVAAADITSITYLGTDGSSATLATTVYKVTAYERSKTRITLKNGQTWPATYLEADAVTINFTAGWGMTAANVWAGPVQVQQAILVMVADWYCNREMVGMSKAAGALLDMVRLHSYG